MIRRRDLLALLAAGSLLPRRAFALGEASQVDVAELTLSSGTVSRPGAWRRLLYEIEHTTSILTADRVEQVAVDDPALFGHPFAVLCGGGELPELTEKSVEQLRRYITYGGFLFIDDTSGGESEAFDRSIRRLVSRMFPTRSLFPLPSDHSLYRSFFLLRKPLGRVAGPGYVEGVELGSMTPLIYGRNDLSGALDRGADGRNSYPVIPGGDTQRREAVKLGINLVMYALTSNYKQDQAHVNELLKEGRL